MTFAITSAGPSLGDMVERDFQSCAYFIIFNPDKQKLTILDNPYRRMVNGVGYLIARLLAQKNVSLLLTGYCSPEDFRIFSNVGIYTVTGISGEIRQALSRYNSWIKNKPEDEKQESYSQVNRVN
jgi:predicted Fe-Mo cluster-binding NifX family protein